MVKLLQYLITQFSHRKLEDKDEEDQRKLGEIKKKKKKKRCMEVSWMADHRVGETGLSDAGPSSHNQPMPYAINGNITAPATNFFSDQAGASYFGELEEALIHGVVGSRTEENRKSFFTSRPPTLEIFPSWPMRFQEVQKGVGVAQSEEESTDSGSAQNTFSHQLESESPVSRKASSEQSAGEQQLQLQEQHMQMQMQEGMIGSGVPSTGAANHEPRAQDKRKVVNAVEKVGKILDAKTLRRLAQNREAARKSRLRKKAYVQQLETSRVRLTQLEQELQKARSQGLFLGGASADGSMSSGAAVFDMEYSRWLDEEFKHMTELRGGLQAHLADGDLRVIVDECLAHYDEIFKLKAIAAKSDVFHLITGMWATPAERCFLWMGGFRPSELLKILIPLLDPLTEQQLVGICSLQQSSQQAEEALSQGLDQLHQSLADTVASGSLSDNSNVADYMGNMAIALGKLANLEGFVRQADNLRQQTLHQMRRILTIRQTARCFLAIGEYNNRLRALSSLWASRPRENLISDQSSCPAPADIQMIHQSVQGHLSSFS